MNSNHICPVCGAQHTGDATCETDFHQMLFWEAEVPARGIVHHLTVLCYHLQHPHLYSEDGLENAVGLLTAFVRDGIPTSEIRRRSKDKVNSKNRAWKVTARPDSKGAYPHPIMWTMHAADVVSHGADHYIDSVRAWAQSVYDAIQAVENS